MSLTLWWENNYRLEFWGSRWAKCQRKNPFQAGHFLVTVHAVFMISSKNAISVVPDGT